MRSVARVATAVLATFTLVSCGSSSPNPAAPAPSGAKVMAVAVASTQTSTTSFQLKATAQLSDGTTRDVTAAATWESSNAALATVSAGGVVTVISSGELDIRATYQGVAGSLHLLVTRVPVTSVTVAGKPTPGDATFQLNATARLSDGTTQDVTRSASWSSSNTSIATVSPIGSVTIVGNGDVDLVATYQGVTGSSHVTVSLPKTFSLTGVVAEAAPNVRPVAGARVQLVVGNFTTTDDRGVFSLAGVPVGRSIIEVSKDGYQVWSNEITVVDKDVPLPLPVTLYPTPPKNADGASATARCTDGSWSWARTKTDACTASGGVAYFVCPGPLCSTP